MDELARHVSFKPADVIHQVKDVLISVLLGHEAEGIVIRLSLIHIFMAARGPGGYGMRISGVSPGSTRESGMEL